MADATCSVDECDSPAAHRGWCTKHYQRWRKHGDPLAIATRSRRPVGERFFEKVNRTDDCWIWLGALNSYGYGQFWVDGGQVHAHRFSYEMAHGHVPADLTLDHLCRTRECVRPDHLEPVTNGENVLRGEGVTAQNARKTHCPQGHAYDAENTYVCAKGKRSCRRCHRNRQRKAA